MCKQKQVLYSARSIATRVTYNITNLILSEEHAAMQRLITCRHTARVGSPHNVLHLSSYGDCPVMTVFLMRHVWCMGSGSGSCSPLFFLPPPSPLYLFLLFFLFHDPMQPVNVQIMRAEGNMHVH